jgi:hypothetical protein
MASAFGVFQIVANDGRQDAMLMATELLNERISRIKAVRRAAGFEEEDQYPSILDIERTHIIFVTAHFKPFASIAFEYHRVDADGQLKLGGNTKYSIPQYGDFFADMVHWVKFRDLTYTTVTNHPNKDVFRYADFVGERLHQKVKFSVNGNSLDEYDADSYVIHRQFKVPPNKREGWWRLVGQELPHEAYLAQETTVQPETRVALKVYDGYQTPKSSHPALEVAVPLLFWFCEDFRLAIPSVAIPYGQRWITITTPECTDLVELVAPSGSNNTDSASLAPLEFEDAALYVNNLFVNAEVHDIFIRRIGFTLIRVHLQHPGNIVSSTGKLKLESLQWPIESMFFGFRPESNYSKDAAVTAGNDKHFMYSRVGGLGTLQNWHRFSHVSWTSEAVQGVQSSRVDTLAEKDYDAISEVATVYLRLTAITGPTGLIAAFRTKFLAEDPQGSGSPKSQWGAYAMAAIEASAAYQCATGQGATVPGVTAVYDTAMRVVNEYLESQAWLGVPDSSLSAAAQLNLYMSTVTTLASPTAVTDDLKTYVTAAATEVGATSTSVWQAVQLSGYLNRHTRMGNCARVEVRRSAPVVSSIGLSAHNVKLYEGQFAMFFHSYLPYRFGGPNVNTPSDESLHLISFALYPGTYQPSGHINVSRAREFFISWQTVRPITSNNAVTLLVLVSAINFLLISDGSASLRYTT